MMRCWSRLFVRRAPPMRPGVPREVNKQLVCVCANEFGGAADRGQYSLRPNERTLTPEERERQKQIDDDYKAANKKVPDQKAKDPWADVRSGPTVTDPKKKQK